MRSSEIAGKIKFPVPLPPLGTGERQLGAVLPNLRALGCLPRKRKEQFPDTLENVTKSFFQRLPP